MALNSTEKEKFFAKSIPISVKDVYTNQTRPRHLFLTMEWQDSSPTMYSRKVLVLSLTDNDDPFFLYNLHLSEEDFQMLKTSQDLLINFVSFPQHIIDYIESCLQEEKNPQPRFVLVFIMNEKLGATASPSQLDIIETNQFKNLTHLSLKFIAASETAVRQYLTSFFRSLKEEKRLLQNKLSFLEQDSRDKLADLQARLGGKAQELELLRKETNAQLSEREAQHSLLLQEERNRLISRHKEEEKRLEEEKKEREHSFRKQIQQLESRVNCLDTLNKELEERNFKQDTCIREQSSRIVTLENEAKRLKEVIQSLERKCEKLKSERREKEADVCDLEKRLQRAEKELHSRAQAIDALQDQLDNNAKDMKALRVDNENLKLQEEVYERHKRAHQEEKDQLEKVIMKVQGKVKEVEAKCERLAKYKATAEEKEKLLCDQRKEMAELNMDLKAKKAEVQTLNNKIEFFHQKIDSLEKDLITKQNVIKFLNSELTKNCIIPQFEPHPNLEVSPSSVAQRELSRIGSGPHRKSTGSDNSPSSVTAGQKSVRINRSTPSTVRRNSSTPAQFYMTDSAYCTPSSDFNPQEMPDHPHLLPDRNSEDENGDMDPEALSAAFGGGDHFLKHSTAKKSTKPARSITPKPTKRR